MHQPIAGAASPPWPAAVSGHAMPVLLVEEDAAIAAVTAEILTDAGYQMDHVAAPAAALALVARQGPHADGLVLSDASDPQHTQAYACGPSPRPRWCSGPRRRGRSTRTTACMGQPPSCPRRSTLTRSSPCWRPSCRARCRGGERPRR